MKGTEKQIAWAKDIQRNWIEKYNNDIAMIQRNIDSGRSRVENLVASGDNAKAEKLQERISRDEQRVRAISVPRLIYERADDAAFIIEYREQRFGKCAFYRESFERGYVSREELAADPEFHEYVERGLIGA